MIWTKFICIVEDYFRNISVKNLNICSETAKISSFHFSHYKSMETVSCHSNQSSYPIGTHTHKKKQKTKNKKKKNNKKKKKKKKIRFYRCYMWNMERIGSTASGKSFENVDDGRKKGRRMPAYTISSPMSLRCRRANNKHINGLDLPPPPHTHTLIPIPTNPPSPEGWTNIISFPSQTAVLLTWITYFPTMCVA